MADMASSIFTALQTLFTNDTGSGGLNESGGTAVVRHFVRRGDPNYEVDRTHNWPMLVVDIHNNEARVWGLRRSECVVRMHLYTNRDENTSSLTTQAAVGGRIHDVFNGAALATQGTTEYSLLNQIRDFQAPSSGTELHRVFEFSVHPIVQVAA